ncbi:SUMF1/EgtB/PvdO family nonheme iron enzyme [Leptolyngbya sp. 'hensonii']|uniref:SUMF1/EgtB/PvdO family nonheme iron enzyme n=1 Tax=Leptolyngbya sp. 'hensonii' TaxID=1922337 RepID=UPI00209B1E85|nr:SUMF1/EgtB/PvdO family nonheme iron enzyme [Leptolyngbya sp. 'hensonii']
MTSRSCALGWLILLGTATAGLAQTCTPGAIDQQIKQLAPSGATQTKAVAALKQCGKSAVPGLIAALTQSPEVQVQVAALDALEQIGPPAVDDLLQQLGDQKIAPDRRSVMVEVLAKIAQTHASTTIAIIQKLTERQLDPKEQPQVRRQATLSLKEIGNPPAVQLPEAVVDWVKTHPGAATGAGSIPGLMLIYLVILGLKPRWLLGMPGKLTIPNTKIELPLGLLLWLKYQPRVLDQWVADHRQQVQERFLAEPTVSDREIHIPIQIRLKDKVIDRLTPDDLRSVFHQSPAGLLIVGEGGVGKTSLACQIARWGLGLPDKETQKVQSLCNHAMLPVLIEQELGETPLLTAIREQLPRMADGSFIPNELLEALLRQRRVLVILDHISEMSDETYKRMKQDLEAKPINALIITARLPEKNLGRPHLTPLEPRKISGARLSTFIQPYLERQGKRDIFEDDAEFFRACTRLSSMMAATLQNATALLVRMYVDQVIDVGGLKTAQLPDNIPKLMQNYLCWLNRRDAVGKTMRLDDSLIEQDAKAIAWECLRHTYYPTDAKYDDVIQALADLIQAENPKLETPKAEAKKRLEYLDQTLRLIQVAANRVGIMLDPVAEYLAAFQVVEYCQQQEADQRWQEFFRTVDAKPDLAKIRGFLLAVRNCCEQERQLPEGVLDGLNQRADLDPEALQQARRRQRINRLIDDLFDDDTKYLGQAIRNLREEGTYAYKAIPDLLNLLQAREKFEPALRIEALTALLHIQLDRVTLQTLLQDLLADRTEEPAVRVAAIDGLFQVSRDSDSLPTLLQRHFADQTEGGAIRVQAGQGLRQLGLLPQLLIVELDETATPTIRLLEPPETRVVELAEGVTLELVPIPGGTFLMGSPDEDDSSYDDERPAHEVTVSGFWMGKFPVTQAQYAAIMGRNPATFQVNGAHRPVETVSWRNAVEFCDRLSQRTGQEFRLPTEAEWEYACRAGTTTPFHFGRTITTDLANYRGTDWDYGGKIYSGSFGQGPKGIYRQQTTVVGTFPPNAFGLYDLHGNVWEWCADHWHEDYTEKPDALKSDGNTPWETAQTVSRRALRGGSWNYLPRNCRSAFRYPNAPDVRYDFVGFRVVSRFPRAVQ